MDYSEPKDMVMVQNTSKTTDRKIEVRMSYFMDTRRLETQWWRTEIFLQDTVNHEMDMPKCSRGQWEIRSTGERYLTEKKDLLSHKQSPRSMHIGKHYRGKTSKILKLAESASDRDQQRLSKHLALPNPSLNADHIKIHLSKPLCQFWFLLTMMALDHSKV